MSDYTEYQMQYYKITWEESLAEKNDEIKMLQCKLAKAREALEFYAEPWERGTYDGDLLVRKIGTYDAFEEVHHRAREALKEIGE